MNEHTLRHYGAIPTTVKCPMCQDIVVYNGNYFCNSREAVVYDKKLKDVVLDKGTCIWALPHPQVVASVDEEVAAQLREWEKRCLT